MERIKKIINKNLSGKKVLLLFILTNLVYAFMLIITIPKTMDFSNGMKLLDMMPLGYNAEYISTLFDTLGEEGRAIYLYNQIPIDMVYPFLFGISSCLVIAYFLRKINKLDTPFFYLCLIPIIAGVSDYFENFGIITMLISFPNLSETSINTTNTFTIIKSMTTSLYFVSLIIVMTIFGIKMLKRKTV